jgi:hypothetical protein
MLHFLFSAETMTSIFIFRSSAFRFGSIAIGTSDRSGLYLRQLTVPILISCAPFYAAARGRPPASTEQGNSARRSLGRKGRCGNFRHSERILQFCCENSRWVVLELETANELVGKSTCLLSLQKRSSSILRFLPSLLLSTSLT